MPFAELPGRFGDQLFGPGAERLDGRVRDDRELVAPVDRKPADRCPETHARGAAWVDGAIVGVHRAERAVEQQVDVVAGDCRGCDADKGERRVSPSDVRIVLEIGAERFCLRLLIERRSRVGDRDEVAPCHGRADVLRNLLVKVRVKRVRLGRRSALARDNE